ncbi:MULTISPECIES: transglutaminase domain-containing protein [Winogradskyella]|uniref:transglutaminase domain-containing protein n=1 Tax=Winogradskyella TaxID=286104 RepID=UPI0015CC3D34|nr:MULTISPECIES: transglutaminase domain-containing protein [Winogradskyella]QXP79027.1 hypothetical protein H0I32_17810 [Winogradskyella sp. HaHa_3_26]
MKKQTLVILFFICFSTFGWSQNYKKADSLVLTYPSRFSSATKLAKRISSDFSTDFDKVRAIYTWIANNVAYDPAEYGKYSFSYSTKSEFEKKEIKFEQKLSSRVTSKTKAVCEGYSVLFKVLCENLNIESKIVKGSSKTVINDIGKRYYSDHAWNIVEIENQKYLVDVTWGAGTYRNGFEKNINYFFFLTDPNQFIKKHYPDEYENSLLTEKIKKEDFLNGPLIYNNDIEVSKPISGIIKKEEVSNAKFSFKTDMEINTLTYYIGKENHRVDVFKKNGNWEFEIDLSELNRQKSLIFYFDYKPIIGFKIK